VYKVIRVSFIYSLFLYKPDDDPGIGSKHLGAQLFDI